MKTLMLKNYILACCFLGTMSLANPCWKNQTADSIMPKKVCFEDIHLVKKSGEFKKIYILNQDVDQVVKIDKLSLKDSETYEVRFKSDYINYSENCGLNLFSKIEFTGFFDKEGKYLEKDHSLSKLTMSYSYSENNCRSRLKSGTEQYTPVIK
ncbi:MAG: hypothetical protein KDD45_00320 [Bdellovibrionales bacterium]|nr:hypothetical protein [Bdellovibrionales bacterium]